MFKHILTATDGSDWALKGVDVAFEMARVHGARLTVLHASESYAEYYFGDGVVAPVRIAETEKIAADRAQEIFESLKPRARERGIVANYIYAPNMHPATAIYTKAEELGCDLIVIGSRGRRGLTKLVMGSQAAEVLAGTKLPVLIVK